MNSFLVFNHHSLPCNNMEEAKSHIPDFIKINVKSHAIGLSIILINENFDKSWYRIELATGYFWQDWFQEFRDRTEYIDLIRGFLSISTRQPLFDEADYREGADLFEVSLDKESESLNALCTAAWFEAPLTSFPTRNPWNESPVVVYIRTLNDSGEITINNTKLNNLYSLDVFDAFKQSFFERKLSLVTSGKDLLSQFSQLYPHIELCGKSVEQLNNWTYSSTILKQVKETFASLNSFVVNWRNDEFSVYSHANLRNSGLNHQVSSESQTVYNDQSLRREREFFLPTGKKEYFENHVKLSQGVRIHFFSDVQKKKIYVGYIGKHLRL